MGGEMSNQQVSEFWVQQKTTATWDSVRKEYGVLFGPTMLSLVEVTIQKLQAYDQAEQVGYNRAVADMWNWLMCNLIPSGSPGNPELWAGILTGKKADELQAKFGIPKYKGMVYGQDIVKQ